MEDSFQSVDDVFMSGLELYQGNLQSIEREIERLSGEVARLNRASGNYFLSSELRARTNGAMKRIAALSAVYFHEMKDRQNEDAYLQLAKKFEAKELDFRSGFEAHYVN